MKRCELGPQLLEDPGGGKLAAAAQNFADSLDAELLAVGIGGLEETVGEHHPEIPGRELDPPHPGRRQGGKEPEGRQIGLEHLEPVVGRMVVKQGRLTRAERFERPALRIEPAEPGGDETVLRQIGAELIVDRLDEVGEPVPRTHRHAQHGAQLSHRERRADAVPGGVGEEEEGSSRRFSRDRHQVVTVAAGLVGGMRLGRDIEPRVLRQFGGPGGALDLARELQVALQLEQSLQPGAHRLLSRREVRNFGDAGRDGRLGLEIAGGDPLAARHQRLDRARDAPADPAGAGECQAEREQRQPDDGPDEAIAVGEQVARRDQHRHQLLTASRQGERTQPPPPALATARKAERLVPGVRSGGVERASTVRKERQPEVPGPLQEEFRIRRHPQPFELSGPGDETLAGVENSGHRAGRDFERSQMREQTVEQQLDHDDAPLALLRGDAPRDGEASLLHQSARHPVRPVDRRAVVHRRRREPPGLEPWIDLAPRRTAIVGLPAARRVTFGPDRQGLPAVRGAAQGGTAAVIGEDSESSDAGAGVEPGQREPAEVRTLTIGLHEAEAGKLGQ